MINKTLTELKEIAKKYEIKNLSKFKKDELISLIEEKIEEEKETEISKDDNGKVRTETVEIEGNDNRDAEYDDNSFYENAPNIKVFAGSGTKTY